MTDLNDSQLYGRGINSVVPCDTGIKYPLRLYHESTVIESSCSVEVYFSDLENVLVSKIKKSEAVVGCVAWLTSKPILLALAERDVSIVVQKEDFLRPDGMSRGWKSDLQKLYHLPRKNGSYMERHWFPLLNEVSYGGGSDIGPYRCVGNHNTDKNPAFPRMHNKFLVFCRWNSDPKEFPELMPYEVWTGSYNMTHNATQSLENAVSITSPSIAYRYFREWIDILSVSEPLDWESEWSQPEWRFGS